MADKKPITIFIADDDEDDIVFFREAIAVLPIEAAIKEFNHGRQVCEYIKDNALIPDIVFLDINMPFMNGIECLKEIRQNERFDYVPVLMYSTSAHEKYLNESFASGADLFIKKANSIAEQTAIIARMMKLFDQGKLLNTRRADFEFNH